MKEANVATSRQKGRTVRFLLCDPTGQSELTSGEGEWVPSPLQCLDKAVDARTRNDRGTLRRNGDAGARSAVGAVPSAQTQ